MDNKEVRDRRETEDKKNGDTTNYILQLTVPDNEDEEEDEDPLFIDAKNKGYLARFLNSSWDPNTEAVSFSGENNLP